MVKMCIIDTDKKTPRKGAKMAKLPANRHFCMTSILQTQAELARIEGKVVDAAQYLHFNHTGGDIKRVIADYGIAIKQLEETLASMRSTKENLEEIRDDERNRALTLATRI